VNQRWLEYRLDGEYALGLPNGRRVRLKGVADRIDLIAGRRLRVIDYKSGYPPSAKRALQVPIYALCAQERLTRRDEQPWTIGEAVYMAFSGRRTIVPVIRDETGDSDPTLSDARDRLVATLDGIADGDFPPKPHNPAICGYCDYSSVCRKDYVGDV
jgi:RecB family exonuclease